MRSPCPPPLSPSRCPEPLSPGPGQSHRSPAVLFLFGAHCRMPKGPEQRDGQPGVPAAAERPARRRAHLRDALAALQLPGKARPSGSSPLPSPCSAAQHTPSQPHPPPLPQNKLHQEPAPGASKGLRKRQGSDLHSACPRRMELLLPRLKRDLREGWEWSRFPCRHPCSVPQFPFMQSSPLCQGMSDAGADRWPPLGCCPAPPAVPTPLAG